VEDSPAFEVRVRDFYFPPTTAAEVQASLSLVSLSQDDLLVIQNHNFGYCILNIVLLVEYTKRGFLKIKRKWWKSIWMK